MNERFIHVRVWSDDDDWPTLMAKGGVTIAYTPKCILDGSASITGRYVTFAVCSDKDPYCRYAGRFNALENGSEGIEVFIPDSWRPKLTAIHARILAYFEEMLDVDIYTKKGRKKLSRWIGEWRQRKLRKD